MKTIYYCEECKSTDENVCSTSTSTVADAVQIDSFNILLQRVEGLSATFHYFTSNFITYLLFFFTSLRAKHSKMYEN